MTAIATAILHLPAALVLVLAFLLPALEASLLFGLVVPGEIAVLLAGVTAHQGSLPLWAVIVVAVAGAVVGDNTGYLLGRRFGRRLVSRLPRRLVRPEHLERGEALLRRLGGRAVLVGRFTAALRALVPSLAGMSGVRYREFTLYNFVGGLVWAGGVAVLGFLAGASYRVVEHRLGLGSAALLAVLVVAGAVVGLRARRLRRRNGLGVPV